MSSQKQLLAAAKEALQRSKARPYGTLEAPNAPGLYVIYLRDKRIARRLGLSMTNPDAVLYVGKHLTSLKSRLRDHLGYDGNSTFRVAMIAILRDELTLGDVCPRFETRKKRATAFGVKPRFSDFRLVSASDEEQLTKWLQTNARIAVWKLPGSEMASKKETLRALELELMRGLKPLANIEGNWANGNAALINGKRQELTAAARSWHQRFDKGQTSRARRSPTTQASRRTPTRNPSTTGRPGRQVSSSREAFGVRRHSAGDPSRSDVITGAALIAAVLIEMVLLIRSAGSAGEQDPKTLSARVPAVVGMDLQSAQDALESEGFYSVDSVDATRMDRWQVLDRNWGVVRQDPSAGSIASTDEEIILFVRPIGGNR